VFWILLCGPALILFATPCLLSARWLVVYAILVVAGLLSLSPSYPPDSVGGNGFSEAFAAFSLYAMTVGFSTGIAARVVMLALRRWHVRWRYVWLAAPGILSLVIGYHYAQEKYREWQYRPPSDACLAATHKVALGETVLRIPTAPVFTLTLYSGPGGFLFLRFPPDHVRTLCKRTAEGRVLELERLTLDFERDVPRENWHWPDALCGAVRDRPWLDRFCAGPVDRAAEHYPWRLVFEPSETVAKASLTRAVWSALRDPDAVMPDRYHRLHVADGNWLAYSCSDVSPTSCQGVFEPRPGLAATFDLTLPELDREVEAMAVAARISEIAADLSR
jgi:hypothetical protein